MNREEILKKSKMENKSRDLYEMEVLKDGSNVGAAAAAILATVFFAVQVFVGGGLNYGLYAVIFVIQAATFSVKAVKLKRRHETVIALLIWMAVIIFSVLHICQLVSTSSIL